MLQPVALRPTHRGDRIQRFSPVSIAFHWVYAAAWLTLVVTGIGFAFESLSNLLGPASRALHRGAAVVFMLAPLAYMAVGWQSAVYHLKEAFSWTQDDIRWLLVAVPYHFTGRPEPPPQGFLNAGQKLNFVIVTLTNVVFSATGLIMWLGRGYLLTENRDVLRWAMVLHSSALWVAVIMFLVHLYMSGLHPFTRRAFRAMVDGYVPVEYALAEHPGWARRHVPPRTIRGR